MPFPSNGMVLIRKDGRILFANTYFCDIVGIHHSRVAGMSYFDLVFPEDLDVAKQLFKINQHLKADPFTLRLRRMDGAPVPVWVDIQFSPMKWDSGRVYAVSATVTAKAESPITGVTPNAVLDSDWTIPTNQAPTPDLLKKRSV